MNKHRHRRIFNKSRGCMMAVAETAAVALKAHQAHLNPAAIHQNALKQLKVAVFGCLNQHLDQWIHA
jgi:hypothetical protein